MLKTNKIHLGDCLEVMKEIKDKSIDLIITDPPYGIKEAVGKNKSRSHKGIKAKDYGKKDWDNAIPDKIYFDEIFRISKNQIIFGGNYFVEYLKNSSCWLVWDKNNTGDFADCELAWTSFKTAVRKYKFTWNGMLQEDMKNKEIRIHPTQKPVKLFQMILADYSKPDHLILDPFSGSGTTAIACHNLNRQFVCIEKDQDYYNDSIKRYKEAKAQQVLNLGL
jgi:site-specific DNA-methyltransferase (adenine-specific)